MSYSGNLDETNPGQGQFARLGAQRIRELTLAVKERLSSVFVNPNSDPLKFKQPVIAMVTTDYVFPATTIAAGLSAAVSVPVVVPVGAVIPVESPVVVNWKNSDSGAVVGAYIIHGWFDGTNVHAQVHNPTGSGGVVTGKTLKLTVFYLATP